MRLKLAVSVLLLLSACGGSTTPISSTTNSTNTDRLASSSEIRTVQQSNVNWHTNHQSSLQSEKILAKAQLLFISVKRWNEKVAENERNRRIRENAARLAEAKRKNNSVANSGSYAGDVWWRLAGCETGYKYDNPNTGNGYYGYFQFSATTWRSVGGTGLPHEHSYEVQKSFAIRLHQRSGWGQWPYCSRKLGLR